MLQGEYMSGTEYPVNTTILNVTVGLQFNDNYMKVVLLFLAASITGNVCIIGVFMKVKQSPVYTRCLFINHAVGDGVTEVLVAVMMAMLVTKHPAIKTITVHILKIVYALHGITIHTLCGIALNLYLSICHSRKYRLLVSWKPFAVFILSCWIFNFGLILPLLYIQEMYSGIIYPNYTQNTFGIWLFVVLCDLAVPIPLVIFCVVKIVRRSSRIEPIRCIASQLQHKMKLSQIITVTAMYYVTFTSAVHLTRILQTRLNHYKDELRVVIHVLIFIMFSYHVLKFPFYLAVYKPIRMEVLKLFKRNRIAPQVKPVRRRQTVNTITV